MLLKLPNWQLLLVAVDHSQLRVMTSETVDPIGRTLLPIHYNAVLSATCTVQMNLRKIRILTGNRTLDLHYRKQAPYLCGNSKFFWRK